MVFEYLRHPNISRMCVFLCVCVRERQRERVCERERERGERVCV